MRLAMLGLALGLWLAKRCFLCLSQLTQFADFLPAKVASPAKLAMIPTQVSGVEEEDTAQQRTEWRSPSPPASKVASYTFHRQINK